MKTTKETIEELRRLHEAATPGPWHAGGSDSDCFFAIWGEDGALIAAMRNNITDLLDDLDSLRSDADAMVREMEAMQATIKKREDLARRLLCSCADLLHALNKLLPKRVRYAHHTMLAEQSSKAIVEATAELMDAAAVKDALAAEEGD